MSEQKIAEIRRVMEQHETDGREIMLSPHQLRYLLSELDKRDEENSRLHRKMIAQRQTTGALQKKADRLEEENRKMREELESHAPEGRNYTNGQYVELLLKYESAQQEIERLKRQDNDVIISYALEKQKLIKGLKAIEKYLASGGDFKAWQMAHDLLQEIEVTVE